MSDQDDWRNLASAFAGRGDAAKDEASAFSDAASAAAPSGATPGQIVFIEGNVADPQILAEGVQPGVKAVILNPDANGVQQIADYLQRHDIQDLDAISIVADGADGELQLGATLLSASNVAAYQPQLAEIGAALKPGGSLLIYGCDVAQGSAGDAFLGDLAAATGVANIAAASHVVGAAADGGGFNLDVDLGVAATANGPFTPATVAAYPDLLVIASNLVWYASLFESTGDTGVYTVDLNGGAAASNPTDVKSTPAYGFVTVDGLAIDPADGHYFVANYYANSEGEDVNQIIEGNANGNGTPTVIYTSGNSGGDAIVGLAFDQVNDLIYMAVTDANIPFTNSDTGIYTISAAGSGPRTATELVNLSGGAQAPSDIAIDTTHNLLFYTDGVPGQTDVEEVGVANLTTGSVINPDLVSYSASGDVQPYGIAVNAATDTLYWTTVNSSANSGNAIYSATYSPNGATLSNIKTLATTSQSQMPFGIGLDVPAGGYYVDTADGLVTATPQAILFGGSLAQPEALTTVYTVPEVNGQTVNTEAIVVETQPTVTASGTVTYVHGAAAIAVDSSATVSNADGDNLAGATVSIASGMGAGDTLNFSNQSGITGSYSSGVLTLTGAATAANYQTALDSVTFSTTSASATPRAIDWTVSDGVVTGPTTTSTVNVHVPPVVTAGATATFDGGGGPVVLDPGLTVSDASSSTLASATVEIVGAESTDRLNFTNQNGIAGAYTLGVLTLSGVATLAHYQTALESITYSVSPSNSDPTDGGSSTGSLIEWTVNDGTLTSTTATSALDTVHTAPTVLAGATATFDGGGSPVTLDSGLEVRDVDSGGALSSATVTIADAIGGDTLNFTNINPALEGDIAVTSDSGGVLKLTSVGGTATLLQWQNALESVTYSFNPSFGDPTGGGSHASRAIDWAVNDGVSNSATATSTLDATHVPPTLTAGGAATYTEGGPAATLDPSLAISDPDSGGLLTGATVQITSGFLVGDTLEADVTGLPSITVTNPGDGLLTLSGSDTLADYRAVLGSVTFSSTNPDPTDGGADTSRTITWTIDDGVSTNATTETSTVDVIPCYCRGTMILTDRGDVAVENLAIGDFVITASGTSRPIRWIGHRKLNCARHSHPREIWPVRVAAGAFGENRPRRDLWLSPGHNIASQGALMPISALLNGRSVSQVPAPTVEYWHVELDAHDILLAEGLPAESYLDTGNRTGFANGGAYVEAHPDFKPKHFAETCLPLVMEGPEVIRTKALLLQRLRDLGHSPTSESDPHVTADGERIDPVPLDASRLVFHVPPNRQDIALVSRTFVPAHSLADSTDYRILGLCVGRLKIDGELIALDDEGRLGAGWHEPERHLRWTRGSVPLPPLTRFIVLDLAGPGHYWREAKVGSSYERRAVSEFPYAVGHG